MREDSDGWMYYYQVDKVVEAAIQAADKEQKATVATAKPATDETHIDTGDKETETVEGQDEAEVKTRENPQADAQDKVLVTAQENELAGGNDRESGLAAEIVGLAQPNEKVKAISVDVQNIPILAASN